MTLHIAPTGTPETVNVEIPRFLSAADCESVAREVFRNVHDGSVATIQLSSRWLGYTRWARNRVDVSGDMRDTLLQVSRTRNYSANQVDPVSVAAIVRYADGYPDRASYTPSPDPHVPANLVKAMELWSRRQRPRYNDVILSPAIWSDPTYALDEMARADVVRTVSTAAEQSGMLSAGYLEIGAAGRAYYESNGTVLYAPRTTAQFSITVRSPDGSASGWAGMDHYDWSKIDAPTLAAKALDKCLRSRHPSIVEPGRWNVVLEPQAVCDLLVPLFQVGINSRPIAEQFLLHPFNKRASSVSGEWGELLRNHHLGVSKLGDKIFDERVTLRTDPTDPELGFVPFDERGEPFRAVTWVDRGVLTALPYDRYYAQTQLREAIPLPSMGAFRMTGGDTAIEEMIKATERGLLITRFSNVNVLSETSILCAGYTRDGTWLIEKGVITHPVKNFRFTESPLFAFNNLEALGTPQRVFHPDAPVVVPPAKIKDFSMTSLSEAV